VGSFFGFVGRPTHWIGGDPDELAWADPVGRGLDRCSDAGLQAGPLG
jgi:hypothetical protein